MKITIELGDELDDVLTLAKQRQLVTETYMEFKALFEAQGVKPMLHVRLESSLMESTEHTPNWPSESEEDLFEEEPYADE
jgi:hypothetical protein